MMLSVGAWAQTTLQEQINNAEAGATIALTENVNLTSTVTIAKSITLDLNGHNITGTDARALHVTNGNVTITGTGTITSTGIADNSSVIRVGDNTTSYAPSLTIDENVKVTSACSYGVTIFGKNASETLIVKGTVETTSVVASAISGNGSAGLCETTITIGENAKISAANDVAIYQPQAGTLTVNGTVSGLSGIEIKAGSLTVGESANITATGTLSHTVNNNGTSTRGYAVAIVENSKYNGVGEVKVSPSATIAGPIATLVDSKKDGFNPTFDGITMVAEVGDTKYSSLADAFAAATVGQTVKLLSDVKLSAKLEVTCSDVTLDLNGKTISPADDNTIGNFCAVMVHRGAKLTVDDTSAEKTGCIDGGTGTNAFYGAIQLTQKEDTPSDAKATLVVNNGTIKGNKAAITGNGNRHNTDITINGGTFIASSTEAGEEGCALYHPQDGTLTINGGTFTGYGSAIEMRSGTLSITGGDFIATATEFSEKANGNGTTIIGAALAISQHTTNKAINVSISGGTFKGPKAVYEKDNQDNNAENINIVISGGTFNAEVYSENVQNFISGGIFSSAVPEEYCANGYIPTDDGEGHYGVKEGSFIAQIGGVKYESIADAIAAVPTDGTETTIKVLENVDLTAALTIVNTKNVVIDLNGKTIKNDASKTLSQLITVNGKLAINDSSEPSTGVIKNTANGKYVIKTGTTASVLTLNNGTVETTTGNSNGAVYGTSGSFVMTGGKIIAAGTGVTSKNVTISSGEITATAGQALCAAGTISGGTFTSANNNAVYANQSGTLEITGGTFAGVSSKPTINIYTTDVKVTGATLNNGVGFASNATAMLLAGTDEVYLANTHAAFYDGETLVGYAPINTGMLANAKVSGKTVKLTKDVATTTYLNVTKSFTLDLNGHNIACTPVKADATILTKGTASAPVELTIKGEGQISCADHGEGCNAIQVSNYATVNIEGGNYSVPGDNSTIYMLATAGNSVVNISGGKFESGDGKYVLNIKDDCRDFNKFNVTGGNFYNFDPANISNEGNPDGNGTNFVADGYISDNSEASNIYIVKPGQWVASITDEVVKKFRFISLDDAIETASSVNKEITITLLSDAETTKETLPDNITIDANSKVLTMPTFEVLDGKAFTLPNVTGAETYKVRKATYIRTNISATEWGTVCLPFSLTNENGADYYTYNNINGSTLTVDETTETVAPHTPVVFQKAAGDLNINEENATVSLEIPTTLESGALVGTYTEQTITEGLPGNIYFINGDKFHQAQVELKVPAYRAYINYTAPAGSAAPRALSIVVGGGDDATAIGTLTTGDADIEAIYDAAGRKLSVPQKGINIMKLANGKTVKLIIK